MNHRRALLDIFLLYFTSPFFPVQTQVHPSLSDGCSASARQVATHTITYGKRDGNSYRMLWSTLLPDGYAQRGNVLFNDHNANGQADSLDALQITIVTGRDGQTPPFDEYFLDSGIDGMVTGPGDAYTSNKNNGKQQRSSNPNTRYADILQYIITHILPEYK
ncbi:MAG TPA: hypothetical protein VJC16_04680 [Candidatus Nanoarchaeia archaeon]|nr:hypothetical protein [Candidatus Nanoarchaeia archaeon]